MDARRRSIRSLVTCGLIAAGLVAGAAGCSRNEASTVMPARPEVLRLGLSMNEENVERRVRWGELAGYLEKKLGLPVTVVRTSGFSAAIEGMRARKLDVCGLGPFAYMIAHEKIGAEPLVAPGINGEPRSYQAGFITWPGSGLRTMDDVRSRAKSLTLSWCDPASTSGHLVPRAHLESIGINAEKDFRQTLFTNSHLTSVMTAKAGKVDVAAVDLSAVKKAIRDGRIAAEDVHILWSSAPITPSLYAIRGGLPAEFREEVRQAFLDLAEDAPALWAKFSAAYLVDNVRWVPIHDHDFDELRGLARSVKHMDLLD